MNDDRFESYCINILAIEYIHNLHCICKFATNAYNQLFLQYYLLMTVSILVHIQSRKVNANMVSSKPSEEQEQGQW